MTADPYRAPVASIEAETSSSTRRHGKLEQAWIFASIVFVALTAGTLFWRFRDALLMVEFWATIAWVPAVMSLGMALASLGMHWVWFGHKGPRRWLRALIVAVPVLGWTILTTVIFPMGGPARSYAWFWLRLVLFCIAVTLIVEASRHAFAAIRNRAT